MWHSRESSIYSIFDEIWGDFSNLSKSHPLYLTGDFGNSKATSYLKKLGNLDSEGLPFQIEWRIE